MGGKGEGWFGFFSPVCYLDLTQTLKCEVEKERRRWFLTSRGKESPIGFSELDENLLHNRSTYEPRSLYLRGCTLKLDPGKKDQCNNKTREEYVLHKKVKKRRKE